jgi:hypothetical protein
MALNNSFGYSSYDSLQVSLEKRLSKGLYFTTSYTFSRALEATSYLNNQDPFSQPARRISGFDAPPGLALLGDILCRSSPTRKVSGTLSWVAGR